MRKYYKNGKLVGGQTKIASAAKPFDKITGEDFKEGKTAKKGLWYNIAQKKKRGEKMRAKGAKGAPTEKAIKKSQA